MAWEETIEKIQSGFKKGENDWKDYLIAIYGEKEADKVIDFIQKSDVSKGEP